LLTLSAPSRTPEKQNLFQVHPIHDGSDHEQRRSGEDGDRPIPPRIAAQERGGHAHRAEGDERLPSLARHRPRAAPTLPKRGHSARLPCIEQDRQTNKRYQDAEEERELFNFHEDI
jgi:hypothetical protein